ncbi:putative bifunctional diguanylate cyclase/phosphodiesterase [Amaricoccus macauensis]|uniref:putative bifunctional diguanylate cyclase/phosphodiesterase n=1 Tax=Amaricoccus macauensis TaxID=57001 RepID=UPI003C7A8DBE
MKQVVLVGLGTILLTFFIYLGARSALNTSVTETLVQSGTVAAEKWSSHLSRTAPDLDRIIAGHEPNNFQAYKLDEAITYSDVFAFSIFDHNGNWIYSSDLLDPNGQKVRFTFDIDAARAYLGGEVTSILQHGTPQDGFPPTYVTAYTQLVDQDSERLGALKVFVDRSEAHQVLDHSISRLSVLLPLGGVFIYMIPGLAFLFRTRQVWKVQENVKRLSDHDALTGLYNRSAFSRKLDEVFEGPSCNRMGVGLIYIDVDNFRSLNDEFGTETGDAYLCFVADILTCNMRGSSDLLARVGGDEFLVAIPNITQEQLEELGLRLQKAASEPFLHASHEIRGDISLGLHLSSGKETASRALYAAEIALFYARDSNMHSLVVYSDGMDRELRERREMESLLRSALQNGSFRLLYQPLVAQTDERIVGFEALLRLPDGQGGQISPARFIPHAEETGLIDEIGLWVLEEALATAHGWPDHITISVNLSPHQFIRGDLVNRVAKALDHWDVPAERLELEITESLLASDNESVDRQLVRLKDLGVSIAMDDFGTGYSSLGYLLKYGFDKLKIDRSFLENIEFDPAKHGRIIETIVSLGHNLGMKVTAEGVETRRQVELLRPIGCDIYQGYFFGKPMEASEAQKLIAQDAQNIGIVPGDAEMKSRAS